MVVLRERGELAPVRAAMGEKGTVVSVVEEQVGVVGADFDALPELGTENNVRFERHRVSISGRGERAKRSTRSYQDQIGALTVARRLERRVRPVLRA